MKPRNKAIGTSQEAFEKVCKIIAKRYETKSVTFSKSQIVDEAVNDLFNKEFAG